MDVHTNQNAPSVLIVDADIVSRHAIAEYLRGCGYAVVEAASTEEALIALGEPRLSIDIALIAVVETETKSYFELANWERSNFPDVKVKLAVNINRAAQTAAELCDDGPHLERPYNPEMVVDFIKRLRAGT